MLNIDLDNYLRLAKVVYIGEEVALYLRNIVTTIRVHKSNHKGVLPKIANKFRVSCCVLGMILGMQFVTPEVTRIVAERIFPHHLGFKSLKIANNLIFDILESVPTPP